MDSKKYRGISYANKIALRRLSADFKKWKDGIHTAPVAFWHSLWSLLESICIQAYPSFTVEGQQVIHLHLMGKLHDKDFKTERLDSHVHYFIRWDYIKNIKHPDIRPDILHEALPLELYQTPSLEETYAVSKTLLEKVRMLIPDHLQAGYIESMRGFDCTTIDHYQPSRLVDRIVRIANRHPLLGSKILSALYELHTMRDYYFPSNRQNP
jgi:hypothetical protein